MAKAVPTTKAAKQRKVDAVMSEFKDHTLRSSRGQKVTNPKQAIAIALESSGQSRRKKGPKS